MISLVEDGRTDQEIADALGTTVEGARIARKRFNVKSRTAVLHSCRSIARLLGLSCSKTVARWIERGWLRGRQGQQRGQHRQWFVTDEALMRFLEEPAHFCRWDPDRITDSALRGWAKELRRGERYLTLSEVGDRFCVQRATVHQWIKKGWLPAVRNGNHLVPESALAGFTLPRIGGRAVQHPDVEQFRFDPELDLTAVVERAGDGWVWRVEDAGGIAVAGSRAVSNRRANAVLAARRFVLRRSVA